jgi:diguanylate cyclase (GGDEF)-like protein/PAS domain S-box-containing protein
MAEVIPRSDARASIGQPRALRSLFIVFTLLLVAAYLVTLLRTWQETLRDTRASLTHVNSMLVQGLRSTVKSHELVLLGLGGELVAQGTLQEPEKGRNLIERMKAIDSGIAEFGLARPDGQLVLVSNATNSASLPNLARSLETRENFLRSMAQKRIQIGRPYFMQALDQWVTPVCVPIQDSNGKIASVMTAAYPLEHGSTAWSTNMTLPPYVTTVLLRKDGYLQHVYPMLPQFTPDKAYGGSVPSETLRQVMALTSVSGFTSMYFPRLQGYFYLAYELIEEHGLLAAAFMPRNAVLAHWFERIMAPTVLLLIYFFGSLWAYRRSAVQQQKVENEVAKLTGWQQAVLDGAEYSIISTDTNGIIVSFNAAAQRMLGYRPEEIIGRQTPSIFHDPDEVARRAAELSEELGRSVLPGIDVFVAKSRLGQAEEREWTYIRKDGSRFPVRLSVTPLHGPNGEQTGFLGIAADLSESKQAQSRLRDSEARYRTLFEGAGDSIFLMEGERFVECNPATLKIFGCTREQILGESPYRFSPDLQPDGRQSKDKALEKIAEALNGGVPIFEWRHCRYDGTPFDAEVTLNAVEIDGKSYLLARVRDISDRKETEVKLEYLAHHDALTGLLNRHAFYEDMNRLLGQTGETGRHALMLIDLDRFKEVNDTLGHHVGDKILQGVGPLLNNSLDLESALVSRLGGDEFTIFLRNVDDLAELENIAKAALQSIKQPFEVDAMKLEIDASIGISLYPQDGDDIHTLLRSADVAMYEAKSRGGGIAFYNATTDKHSPERLAIMAELGNAVRENQLCLHYQPQFDLRRQQVTGFEALVRWQHPQLGLLYPDRFIPFAEVSDVIHPLTLSVLQQALEQQRQWKAGGHGFMVSVNLSARNLIDDRFVNLLQGLLQQYDTQPGELELEVTESALMQDPEGAAGRLERIVALGVTLSIDDFGTGYSSLAYLRRLPIHELKIDRLFVKDMLANEQDASIVRSTIGLAHNLNLQVVAEGVESAEIQSLLEQMGCDLIQGYHLSRPKAWDEISDWLDAFAQAH